MLFDPRNPTPLLTLIYLLAGWQRLHRPFHQDGIHSPQRAQKKLFNFSTVFPLVRFQQLVSPTSNRKRNYRNLRTSCHEQNVN